MKIILPQLLFSGWKNCVGVPPPPPPVSDLLRTGGAASIHFAALSKHPAAVPVNVIGFQFILFHIRDIVLW